MTIARTDWEIRRDQHYTRINGLNAELRGYMTGTFLSVDRGFTTAEQALAEIRAEAARTAAAIEASWDELERLSR